MDVGWRSAGRWTQASYEPGSCWWPRTQLAHVGRPAWRGLCWEWEHGRQLSQGASCSGARVEAARLEAAASCAGLLGSCDMNAPDRLSCQCNLLVFRSA